MLLTKRLPWVTVMIEIRWRQWCIMHCSNRLWGFIQVVETRKYLASWIHQTKQSGIRSLCTCNPTWTVNKWKIMKMNTDLVLLRVLYLKWHNHVKHQFHPFIHKTAGLCSKTEMMSCVSQLTWIISTANQLGNRQAALLIYLADSMFCIDQVTDDVM